MRDNRIIDVLPNGESVPEDDVEAAFEDWRKGLEDSESPGHIRAFRLPLDENNRASHNSTGQVRLGTWPIDQYDFDTLCTKLMREFMMPSENLMAVRLIGTLTGKSGVRFNKIVTLQRPNQTNALPNPAAKDGLSDVMRAVQESNERTMRMFQEMRGNVAQPDGSDQMMRTVAMMRALMEPMQAMMGPIMAAAIGRPAAPAGPTGSMRETLETMMLMDKFLGRRGGGGSVSPESGLSDIAQIATAVSGVAKPLLEMAVANKQGDTRTRKSLTPAPQPMASFKQPHVQTPSPPPPVTHAPLITDQPSPLPAGSLSPGPDTSAPSSEHPGNPQMFAETKKQIDALVQLAQGGVDATAVADRFFEDFMMRLSDDDYGTLCGAIERENFLDVAAIYNTGVKAHAPWFQAFRGQIIKRVEQEDGAAEPQG